MDNWLFPEEVIEQIRQNVDKFTAELIAFADTVSRTLSDAGYSMQDVTEAFEKLFRQPEEQSIKNVGTSPKKYGMSLRKRGQRETARYYNYIPRPVRNQPYQRRAY